MNKSLRGLFDKIPNLVSNLVRLTVVHSTSEIQIVTPTMDIGTLTLIPAQQLLTTR